MQTIENDSQLLMSGNAPTSSRFLSGEPIWPVSGLLAMPSVRHRRSVLAGLGVAGSVLGAVVAAFALASAIVAFSVWPEDPIRSTPPAYTLDAPTVVERGRADPALVVPAPASTGATTTSASAGRTATGDRDAARRDGAPPAAAGLAAQGASGEFDPGAPATDGDADSPAPPPPPVSPSDEDGLGQLGGAVDGTTSAVARSLRAVTGSLGDGLRPVSPLLHVAVTGLGAGLGTTVQNVGRALAMLLGHSGAPQTAVPPRPGAPR